jgi:peptidoglycan/xylan/chitin deacetylase (PgdA/CDA1 family)
MSAAIPILLYHSISESASARFREWSVRPGLFAAHMQYLQRHGYTPITVTQLAADMSAADRSLPDRPVVITFDDGFADFYTEALPVLKDCGFTATLFVVTGLVGSTSRWLLREREGNRLMLSWDQIATIVSSGIECGTHSHTHVQLDTLPPAVASAEITCSKAVLEDKIGREVSTIAYPNGYHNSTVLRLVRQAGYSSACAVKNAMSAVADDRFALSRIIVSGETGVEEFATLLIGRGLRVAPLRERITTKGWRFVRRSAGFFTQRPRTVDQLEALRNEWSGK